MNDFNRVLDAVARHHGDPALVSKQFVHAKTKRQLVAQKDDRWLSEASKCVFQAGFNWQVIENKWEGFENAFNRFDLHYCSAISEDGIDQLLQNTAIVRHYQKIKSVVNNAYYFSELVGEHGGLGKYFSGWSIENYSDHIVNLQKNASRLGGKTGQVFLRRMGVDTLVFTPDVVSALTKLDVLSGKAPSSKKDWKKVQDLIDLWACEGYGLNQISQFLALSEG